MHGRVTAALAALVTLSLAACGDEGEPPAPPAPADFTIRIARFDVPGHAGGTAAVPIVIDRAATGAAAEVQVSLVSTGPNLAADPVTIPAGASTGTLSIRIAAGVANGETRFALHATSGSIEHDAHAMLAIDVAAGLLDPDFGAGGFGVFALDPDHALRPTALAPAPDGSFVVAGVSTRAGVLPIARVTGAGSLDPAFGQDGVQLLGAEGPAAIAVDDGNRVYVAERAADAPHAPALTRMTPQGQPDATFGRFGGAVAPIDAVGLPLTLVVSPGGVRVAGVTDDSSLWSGTIETTGMSPVSFVTETRFDPVDQLIHGELLADGGWVFVGGSGNQSVAMVERLAPDGQFDPSFGVTPEHAGGRVLLPVSGWLRAVVPLADGKVVAVGARSKSTGGSNGILLRLLADGTLDPEFGENGVVDFDFGETAEAMALAVQDDGKILVLIDGRDSTRIVRMQPDGRLRDFGFANGGVLPVSEHLGTPPVANLGYPEALVLDGRGGAVFAVAVDDARFALGRILL